MADKFDAHGYYMRPLTAEERGCDVDGQALEAAVTPDLSAEPDYIVEPIGNDPKNLGVRIANGSLFTRGILEHMGRYDLVELIDEHTEFGHEGPHCQL